MHSVKSCIVFKRMPVTWHGHKELWRVNDESVSIKKWVMNISITRHYCHWFPRRVIWLQGFKMFPASIPSQGRNYLLTLLLAPLGIWISNKVMCAIYFLNRKIYFSLWGSLNYLHITMISKWRCLATRGQQPQSLTTTGRTLQLWCHTAKAGILQESSLSVKVCSGGVLWK